MRVAVAASLAAIAGALALDQAGFFPHSWIWAAVLFLWVGALAVVMRDDVRVAPAELVWLAALAALTLWTLLSHVWSDAPSQTLLETRRDLVYLGAAAAVVAIGRRALVRTLPAALLVAIEIVLLVALSRYLAQPAGRRVVPVEGALLSWPLGYANAVAALAALGLPLALAFAATGERPWMRAAGAAGIAPLLASLVLAESRGGQIAAAAAVLALLLLDPRRVAVARTTLALVPLAAGVLAACAASGLTSTTLDPDAVRRGRLVVALALPLGAVVMGAIASRIRPPDVAGRLLDARALVAVAATAVALAAVVAALPRLGGDRAVRALFGAPRAAYWNVAWTQVAAHPGRGTGAGTFARYWLVHGRSELGGALDAHNVYLETLAELGPVGLLLLLLALATPLTAAPRAAERSPIGAATAAAYVAFLADAFVEWDWELPAVTASALLLGGSVLVLGRRAGSERPLSGTARMAVVALALALGAAALAGVHSDAVPGATAAGAAAAPCVEPAPRSGAVSVGSC